MRKRITHLGDVDKYFKRHCVVGIEESRIHALTRTQ
jgi:hypothetical protein